MFKKLLFIGCFTFVCTTIGYTQQNKISSDDEEILRLYENQLSEGLSTRGIPDHEIAQYMARGKDGIKSIDGFTKDLQKLYPASTASKIAILFFVFSKDTLYRFFIVPGLLKEKKIIPITKIKLEQLNTDIFNSLKIYEQTKSRSPIKRGAEPLATKKSSRVSFDQAIINATSILLPESFDEQFEHLIVVPAFSIGTFPFQLLRPYKDKSFLVDKCSFTIAPGLLDFMAVRKKIVRNNFQIEEYNSSSSIPDSSAFTLENALFVCNPLYPKNTSFIFPDLPGAKKEIEASIRYANNYKLLEGAEATKEKVLKNIRNSDVVYFATHGMSSEENPKDNNYLVLSGEADPFLTTRDIMELRDKNNSGNYAFPQMVILSACQTGLGKSMEAGITAGIARSFLIAGASQVIMSLWSVDDESTAYLMSRFIFHLKNKNQFSPSEPLRQAQLDTRKKYPNPIHWASFSVYEVDY